MKNVIPAFYSKNKTFLTACAFAVSLTLLPVQGFADYSCEVVNISDKCNALGYTKSASDCSGRPSLKCFFDESKLFCNNQADGPVEKECDFGDILYSDHKCYSGVPEDLYPVAVVVDPDNRFGLALTIEEFYMYEGHHPASSPYISNVDQENLTYVPDLLEYWNLDSYYSGEDIERSGFLRVDSNYFFDIMERYEEFSKYTIPGVTALDSFYLRDICQNHRSPDWFVPTIGVFASIANRGPEGIKILNNVLANYHPLINAELDAAEGIDAWYASGYHISEIPTFKYSDSFALRGHDEIPDEAYVSGYFPMAKIIVEPGAVILGFTSTTAAEAIGADPTGNVLRCMVVY